MGYYGHGVPSVAFPTVNHCQSMFATCTLDLWTTHCQAERRRKEEEAERERQRLVGWPSGRFLCNMFDPKISRGILIILFRDGWWLSLQLKINKQSVRLRFSHGFVSQNHSNFFHSLCSCNVLRLSPLVACRCGTCIVCSLNPASSSK